MCEELAALVEVLDEAVVMVGVGVEALRLPWRTARGILLRPVLTMGAQQKMLHLSTSSH
jgi:hypothetical protein